METTWLKILVQVCAVVRTEVATLLFNNREIRTYKWIAILFSRLYSLYQCMYVTEHIPIDIGFWDIQNATAFQVMYV